MTMHNRKWKEEKKEEIKNLAEQHPYIAVATLELLPARVASIIRKRLKGDAVLKVAKTRVVKKALEESNVDISKLEENVKDSVAIIFSKKNPFELYSFIKKNKSDAAAKAGDIAEKDIIVQAGDTGLPPGPALSGLKAAGLKVKVEGPTISVTNDKVVTKKGEEVSPEVADVLTKLDIRPMKVAMQVLGVLDKEEQIYYASKVLDVDEEELFEKFVMAYQQAMNLSVNAGYINDDNAELIIVKAEREAKALQESLGEPSETTEKETTENSKEEENKEEKEEVKEENVEEKKEEVKEEPKEEGVETTTEDKKEEVKEETTKENKEEVKEESVEENKEVKEENTEANNEESKDKTPENSNAEENLDLSKSSDEEKESEDDKKKENN